MKAFDQYQKHASEFAKIDIEGTDYLAFRDMPKLLSRYGRGKKVLDYGSGAGRSTRFLKSLGFDTVGVDISQKMLKQARLRDVHGKYCHIKSGHLPFKDSSFDIIFFSFVFIAISSKKEIKEVLSEARRVLKKDGVMVNITNTPERYRGSWTSCFVDFPENKKTLKSGDKVKLLFKGINLLIYDYYWTEEDYRKVFYDVGLNLLKTHKPVGRNNDPYEWLDEAKIPPIVIHILGK